MQFKYTPQTLAKIERLFEESGYVLRYEKGTFTSGYCILENKKVVVINKFLNVEGRINTLLDILNITRLQEELLSADSYNLYLQLSKSETSADPGDAGL